MSEYEKKVEASMPVQSRIDLRVLAELALVWEDREVTIKSMSQLVSWSLESFRAVLRNNGISITVDSLLDANEILGARGLVQASMKKRMQSKYNAARGFEEIRTGGSEVNTDYIQYKQMHKPGTVEAYKGSMTPSMSGEDRAEFEKIMQKDRELEEARWKKDSEQQKKAAIESSRASGRLVDSPVKYGKGKVGDVIIDVDENVRKMKEYDKKLDDMP